MRERWAAGGALSGLAPAQERVTHTESVDKHVTPCDTPAQLEPIIRILLPTLSNLRSATAAHLIPLRRNHARLEEHCARLGGNVAKLGEI